MSANEVMLETWRTKLNFSWDVDDASRKWLSFAMTKDKEKKGVFLSLSLPRYIEMRFGFIEYLMILRAAVCMQSRYVYSRLITNLAFLFSWIMQLWEKRQILERVRLIKKVIIQSGFCQKREFPPKPLIDLSISELNGPFFSFFLL